MNNLISFTLLNSDKIDLVISGNGEIIKKREKLFLNKEVNYSNETYLEFIEYNYQEIESINKNKIPKYIYSLP